MSSYILSLSFINEKLKGKRIKRVIGTFPEESRRTNLRVRVETVKDGPRGYPRRHQGRLRDFHLIKMRLRKYMKRKGFKVSPLFYVSWRSYVSGMDVVNPLSSCKGFLCTVT